MASLINRGDGRRAIQFENRAGYRKTIGLGKITDADARSYLIHVEALVANVHSGGIVAIPQKTAEWLGAIAESLRRKLVAVELIAASADSWDAMTLGGFLESYVAGRADVKPATRTVMGHTKRCLVEFLGADKPLASITAGDADDWRQWLIGDQKLADNTVRRRCGIARQYLNAAKRKRLVAENPFDHLSVTVRGSSLKRRHYVSPADAAKVMDACSHDPEWQALFALARWGGLRVPSEAMALKWTDVNWERNRICVKSAKTEHHGDGHGERVIPLFPELHKALQAAYDAAPEGATWVIERYRDPKQNLRTQLKRFIRRAGLAPWPKLWVNLRASRVTELASQYPSHVAAAWCGHSVAIAQEHYTSVRDEDFDKATMQRCTGAAESDVTEGNRAEATIAKHAFSNGNLALCGVGADAPMGDEGLEPPTPSV